MAKAKSQSDSIGKKIILPLNMLSDPFEMNEIHWRVGRSGFYNEKPWVSILAYINARSVMDRLDRVVGPANWQDKYEILDEGIKCRLSIKIDGEWVTKEDASQETKVEALKGGFSKALVRAAVKWGIGRDLYSLSNIYGTIVPKKTKRSITSKIKDQKGKEHWITWEPPLTLQKK